MQTLNDDILFIENLFLSFGAERMSKYFGDADFEKNIPADRTLWDKDECYYMVCEDPFCSTNLMIKYRSSFMHEYKILKTISRYSSKEQQRKEVLEIMKGWTPEEEQLLMQYIDLNAGTHLFYDVQRISFYTSLRENAFEIFSWKPSTSEYHDFEYEEGLCPSLDSMYHMLYTELYSENEENAFHILCDFYVKCCNELGSDHPNSLSLLYDFTVFFSEKIAPEELLQIYLRLYQYQKELHGNTYSATLDLITEIALLLCTMEKYKDSILLHKFVYRAFSKKYGADSPKTICSYSNLILPYYCRGWIGYALNCAEKCLEYSDLLEFMECIRLKQWISLIHRESHFTNHLEEALKYDLEILEDLKTADDSNFPLLLKTMQHICLDHIKLHHFSEAVSLESYLTTIASEHFGPFHEITMFFREDFIIELYNNGQKQSAINFAHTEYLRRKRALGKDHEYTLDFLLLYEALKGEL